MAKYKDFEEIPCSKTITKNGREYIVRQFGLGGVVFVENHIPKPTVKIIMTYRDDGEEDEGLREEIPIQEHRYE